MAASNFIMISPLKPPELVSGAHGSASRRRVCRVGSGAINFGFVDEVGLLDDVESEQHSLALCMKKMKVSSLRTGLGY